MTLQETVSDVEQSCQEYPASSGRDCGQDKDSGPAGTLLRDSRPKGVVRAIGHRHRAILRCELVVELDGASFSPPPLSEGEAQSEQKGPEPGDRGDLQGIVCQAVNEDNQTGAHQSSL
jgi:hypothetical protein